MNEREAMLWSAGFDCGVTIATRLMRDGVSVGIDAAKRELATRIKMNLERPEVMVAVNEIVKEV